MTCKQCQSDQNFKVTRTQEARHEVMRVRECLTCRQRRRTFELWEEDLKEYEKWKREREAA